MSRVRAYAQLVRLPNVFTAWADIFLGGLALAAPEESRVAGVRWLSFSCVLAASTCLYWAGMVWNDVFDVEQDRRERPFRPIPSGRVTRGRAVGLGSALLFLGVILALLSGWRAEGLNPAPAVFGGAIAVMVMVYDGWLKRTPAGPLGMGGCRFLNVLLGVSWAGETIPDWGWHGALAVGLYITGVTWFARTEAAVSRRWSLEASAALMLAALATALLLPLWFGPEASFVLFPYLLAGLGIWVGVPVCQAIARPKPVRVQAAVRRAIFGLIALDAILASAVIGPSGLAILLLLPPTLMVGRWIYST